MQLFAKGHVTTYQRVEAWRAKASWNCAQIHGVHAFMQLTPCRVVRVRHCMSYRLARACVFTDVSGTAGADPVSLLDSRDCQAQECLIATSVLKGYLLISHFADCSARASLTPYTHTHTHTHTHIYMRHDVYVCACMYVCTCVTVAYIYV